MADLSKFKQALGSVPVSKPKKEQKETPRGSVADFIKIDQQTQKEVPRPVAPGLSPEFAKNNPTINSALFNLKVPQKSYEEPQDPFYQGLKYATQGVENAFSLGLMPKVYDAIGIKQDAPITPFQKGALTAGELVGSVVPVSKLYGAAQAVTAPIKATSTLGQLAKTGLTGGLAGGAYGGLESAIEGNSAGQVGKDALLNAALFATGDVALKGLGVGYNALKKSNEMPTLQNLDLSPAPFGGRGSRSGMLAEPETGLMQKAMPELSPRMNMTRGNLAESVPPDITIPKPRANTQTPGMMPEKMQPLGGGQKARSFPVSTFESEIASPELKQMLKQETVQGGRGAYNPVKLADVDVQAQQLVRQNKEGAYRFLINEQEPSALHTATGIRLIEQFQKEGNYERAIDVSMSLAEKLTKQGQAISAARIVGSLSPEGVLTFAQREIRKINNSRKFPGLTKEAKLDPETARNLTELANRVKNAADENVRIEASQELQAALQALKPAGIGKKLATGQTIAQLLNPKTIIRNVVGNELFYRLERVNKYVGTGIDWTKTVLTGKQREVTFAPKQGVFWKSFITGAKAGWKGVSPSGLTSQYDVGTGLVFDPKGPIGDKTLSFLERTLGSVLRGFDYAAYNRAKQEAVAEMAKLTLLNQKIPATPKNIALKAKEIESNVLDIADQYGKYITFQDNNLISRGLDATKRGLNLGMDFGLGDLVLKYPKTPGALIARGLEYSPAGFIKSFYEFAKIKNLVGGKASERELINSLSRAITGTAGLTGAGYFLADKGIITGSPSDDKDLNALDKQTGTGQYRINVSGLKRFILSGFNTEAANLQEGDIFVNYDWAQPVAMALSAGANVAQSVNDKLSLGEGASKLTGALEGAIAGGINTVAEQPVLQGVRKLVQGYGSESLGGNLVGIAKEIPASFAPTLFNQIKQAADNTVRSTYSPSPLDEALNKLESKIPGRAGKLPVSYDTFGRPRETYQDGGNNLFNVFLNPAFVSKYKVSPEAKMVIDMYKQTGETKQIPRVTPKYIRFEGKKIDLTPEEYSNLQRIVGQATLEGFSQIPDEMDNDTKLWRMMQTLDEAGKVGREEILRGRGLIE